MADTFTDFVQNLFPSLGQVQQPMLTSTFTDPSAYRMSPEAAAYYADPFRKQNAIQQASLDAALKKKQADEAAQRLSGMLSGGGDGGMDMGLTQSQIDFLNDEAMTPGARDARMSNINNILTTAVPALFGLPSPSIIGGMFNLGRQGVANMFNLSQQPAPVVNMSSPSTGSTAPDPFSDTAQLGGGYGYGFDPEVGAPASSGGGGGGGASASDAGAGMSSTSTDAGAVTTDSGVSVGYGGGYGW